MRAGYYVANDRRLSSCSTFKALAAAAVALAQDATEPKPVIFQGGSAGNSTAGAADATGTGRPWTGRLSPGDRTATYRLPAL
jgi:hypothetical protein